VRAERRAAEVTGLDYETVAADMARRDALDAARDESPMRQPDDALVFDTTDLTIDEVVEALARRIDG